MSSHLRLGLPSNLYSSGFKSNFSSSPLPQCLAYIQNCNCHSVFKYHALGNATLRCSSKSSFSPTLLTSFIFRSNLSARNCHISILEVQLHDYWTWRRCLMDAKRQPLSVIHMSYGTERSEPVLMSAILRHWALWTRSAINTSITHIWFSRQNGAAHTYKIYNGRSRWPRGLKRGSAAARLLALRLRISPRAGMSVCCECCVL